METALSTRQKKRQTAEGQKRPWPLSLPLRLVIVGLVFLVYAFSFLTLFGRIGPAAGALMFVPAAVSAGILGRVWTGALAGVAAVLLNITLLYVAGADGLQIMTTGGLPGSILVILMATVIGGLSQLLTRLRIQSRELAIARDQALAANRVKTEILSKVSHDLRTPINAILGYAELIAGEAYGPVTAAQKEKLATIIQSSQELEYMVSDLLDVNRLEAGRLKLQIKPVPTASLMERLLVIFRPRATAKGLTLAGEIGPGVPAEVETDPQRLNQILTNLVDNALKYTHEGEVQIYFERPDPDHWAVRVADTGRGIAPEAQTFIFDAFRQADYLESHNESGVGLGLAIVSDLTEMMGGEVQLESGRGTGSTFTIILPLQPEEST